MDASKLIEEIVRGAGELRAHADEIDENRLELNELRHIVVVLDELRAYHGPSATSAGTSKPTPAT